MKINILLVALFALIHIPALNAQDLNDWENPAVTGINKLPARATMYSFSNKQAAINLNKENSDRVKSLNGTWQFNFSTSPSSAPENFLNKYFKDWTSIEVPANWELQGFGMPIYTNSQHPWGTNDYPNIPEDNNPVGIYKRKFTVPNSWQDMQVRIHFGGVTSAFYLYINGEKVGYSQGSRLPAEFDISPYLKKGENTVIAKVFRWSDGSYLEAQDHWKLSGIHRDVLLLAEPKTAISDFFVKTELDKEYKNATLLIKPSIKTSENTDYKNWQLSAELFDTEGEPIAQETIPLSEITDYRYSQRWTEKFDFINIPIENPKKWTAETPNLYTLTLSLIDLNSEITEVKSTSVGFRKYETKDGVFMVNGQPVKIYGVNRHDHNQKTGKTVSYEDMKRDVELLKLYNFNAVRTSHYPNNPEFYDLCDEYGIYVMDEANIESHGLRGELTNNSAWGNAFLDRMIRMVERDKNHPSIFSWSLGNESGLGPLHGALSGYTKYMDPDRLVHYEGANGGGGKLSPQSRNTPEDPYNIVDFVSRMYPTPQEFLEMDASQTGMKPLLAIEYSHAMGNSNGGLKDIWDIVHASPRWAGGFIWDWMDQGILVEKDGCEQYAYGGYFGEPYHDSNFNINGIINSDQTVKPVMYECKYIFQPFVFENFNAEKNTLEITKRRKFAAWNDYEFSYEIQEDGISIATGAIADGANISEETHSVILDSNYTEKKGKEYHLNVYAKLKKETKWADKGYVQAQEQFALPATETLLKFPQAQGEKISIKEQDVKLIIENVDFEVVFDTKVGTLEEFSFKNKDLITSPVKPNFWRAMTDNDRLGWHTDENLKFWKSATQNQTLLKIEEEKIDDHTIIINTYHQLADGGATQKTSYTINSDASIEITSELSTSNHLSWIPRIGVELGLAPSLSKIKWFGKGPHENYNDRSEAAFVGQYNSNLEEFPTSYVYPQANANRMDTRWVQFKDKKGDGLKFTGSLFEFSAYPYSNENLEKATNICELEEGDYTTLNIDHKQMGVGGFNSWSWKAAPLEKYRIPPGNYIYKIKIQPVGF
ncbi:glycoside hydrolase family 2 TIM barrel-domain containing protein [Christiangramia forsetii]|uniref:Beta-galactosidase n=2 Tax=Christiangramia forsetii TaxID=411153 RepID=A0M224_CHRFK|nr:glycoside hydrolase family 2 TIM barrel-domain containing protein [Christiangramia forsetii]GGG40273.1 beta-galactosidase [Christiangramia forsetii]CAL66669.1 beta-galactosidase [Christiangramia forsetii KT0803]